MKISLTVNGQRCERDVDHVVLHLQSEALGRRARTRLRRGIRIRRVHRNVDAIWAERKPLFADTAAGGRRLDRDIDSRPHIVLRHADRNGDRTVGAGAADVAARLATRARAAIDARDRVRDFDRRVV